MNIMDASWIIAIQERQDSFCIIKSNVLLIKVAKFLLYNLIWAVHIIIGMCVVGYLITAE